MPTDVLQDRLQATLGAAYVLTRELGGGGMSRVFLARDAALERDVVVKVLHPDLAAGVSAERFTREIKLAAGLQQANIVPLLAAGETGGLPYYTMPFVKGRSLRDRLARDGALPVAEAISIVRDVARALAYAHAEGVVHRDIKPENILLSEGTAVVTDFGIAKALAAAKAQATTSPETTGTLTQLGTSVGTPAYMAPEQASGDPTTDHRADLYALGCVAYELLSGAAPFANLPPHQLLVAHLTETPASLVGQRADVPRALAELVAACLAKDPDRRPPSARVVLTALDSISLSADASTAATAVTRSMSSGPARGADAALRRVILLAGAAAAVLAVALVTVRGPRAHRRSASAVAVPPTGRSIAVLPFENLGDSAEAYFADGMTDAVRGELSDVPGLTVIGRASSVQYRGSIKTPQQIGQELGVNYLLTATVRWQKSGVAGGVRRVQVRPELITVRDAATKWQAPFDAALTDVFQVQADIAGRVAGQLNLALGDRTKRGRPAVPTVNLDAYDAFLRAQDARQRGAANDVPSLRRAIPLYEQAVTLDSAFVRAWSGLANARALLYANGTPTPALAEQARQAAEQTQALAPGGAEALMALGTYHRFVTGDLKRALALYENGLRVAPNDVVMLARAARAEQAVGRWEPALAYFRRARALDPRSATVARGLADVLLRLRRLPEARATNDSALALAPPSLDLIQDRALMSLAAGDLDGARSALRGAPATVNHATLLAYVANYFNLVWILDDADQQALLALPVSAFDNDRGTWGIVRAQTYALRGDLARARIYADSAQRAYDAQLRAVPGDAQRHVLRGLALAYLGQRTAAVAEGERGTQLLPVSRDAVSGPYLQHLLARIYTLAGEREKAMTVLEGLLRVPYVVTPGWLRIDVNFAPLRGDPRFERLTTAH